MVEVKHITKSFEGRVVLNDISAVFETGKTNLIIGRSGSGVFKPEIPRDHPSQWAGNCLRAAALAGACG